MSLIMGSMLAATERVRLNIERLIGAHRKLKEENGRLASENGRLAGLLSKKEEAISALEGKSRLQRLAKTVTHSTENTDNTKEIKVRINELVREVDKCISLLNK